MKKTLLFLVATIASLQVSIAFDIYDDITAALRSGNSAAIAAYFDRSVDLTILSQEDVYSKAQAEIILKDFFNKNAPKSFNIIHKGTSKDGSMFGIGSLATTSGASFRVTFYLKPLNGSDVIQELRIEKE